MEKKYYKNHVSSITTETDNHHWSKMMAVIKNLDDKQFESLMHDLLSIIKDMKIVTALRLLHKDIISSILGIYAEGENVELLI